MPMLGDSQSFAKLSFSLGSRLVGDFLVTNTETMYKNLGQSHTDLAFDGRHIDGLG